MTSGIDKYIRTAGSKQSRAAGPGDLFRLCRKRLFELCYYNYKGGKINMCIFCKKILTFLRYRRFIIFFTVIVLFIALSSPGVEARPTPYGNIDLHIAKDLLTQKELSPIEGIWELKQKGYVGHFLIIENLSDVQKDWDYLSLIIDSTNGADKPGEIKFLLKTTRASNIFDCNYYQKGTFNTVEIRGQMTQMENALQFPLLKLSNKINIFIKTFPED
jgi:hypothetical protein